MLPVSESNSDLARDMRAIIREQLLAGSVDLMVLDELGLAVDLGWLAAEEVRDSLEDVGLKREWMDMQMQAQMVTRRGQRAAHE